MGVIRAATVVWSNALCMSTEDCKKAEVNHAVTRMDVLIASFSFHGHAVGTLLVSVRG